MSFENLYIEQFDLLYGNKEIEFGELYDSPTSALQSQTCYQHQPGSAQPHFDLLHKLLKSHHQNLSSMDMAIFSATKLESYGLAGDFHLQTFSETYDLPFPITPLFGYGCAGLLGVVKHHARADRRTLWLSADCVGFSDTRRLGNDALMSDAAGFCVLSSRPGPFKIKDVYFEQDGKYHMVDTELDSWNKNYFMRMNFLFRKILKNNQLEVGQLKFVLPHFTNIQAWSLFQSVMKFSDDQIFSQPIGKTGHFYGLDLLYSMKYLLKNSLVQSGDQLVFLSAGVGASFGVILIEVSSI